MKWILEDELHAERNGEFDNFDDLLAELRRRAEIPWDQEPNRAPCQSWRTCKRRYEFIEMSGDESSWREFRRTLALEISASGVQWHIAPQ